jgi:hypothetical protein
MADLRGIGKRIAVGFTEPRLSRSGNEIAGQERQFFVGIYSARSTIIMSNSAFLDSNMRPNRCCISVSGESTSNSADFCDWTEGRQRPSNQLTFHVPRIYDANKAGSFRVIQ